MVSILVLLDDAYRLVGTEDLTDRNDVSILVLLDDAYRHSDELEKADLLAEFQSLFFWMMPTGS